MLIVDFKIRDKIGYMNYDYKDIRSRIINEPVWFDEHAVPRYNSFSPSEIANIYATEAALVRVDCQACNKQFLVAFSHIGWEGDYISLLILNKNICYGDPPNIGCCSPGPTMSSISRRVVEYWKRKRGASEWCRDKQFEIILDEE